MKVILGISAYYHDAAAALLVDGRIVAAAQEERYTRRRHDAAFPIHAIKDCLRIAGLTAADIDTVVSYEKPLRKIERLIENYLAVVPAGYRSFRQAVGRWTHDRPSIAADVRRYLPEVTRRIVYPSHHESHAASAYFPSPFDQAAILTIDGVGEWQTASIGSGQGNRISIKQELRYPHSLGLLYSAFTYYCGFRVNSGEYKLMGLAPYGRPVYRDLILERLIDLKDDGSLWMDMSYFNYCRGLTMTTNKFHRLFGQTPRRPESELTDKHKDLAASIQSVTEEVMVRMARHAVHISGSRNLAMAGGVALNCVGNGRILREGVCDRIWIQPAAGDAGGALGAALFLWHQLLGKPRTPEPNDSQCNSRLGSAFSDQEIQSILTAHQARYEVVPSDADLCDWVARAIDNQQIVGWFQGRMEFGPRALGGRSILGDARSHRMQSIMNIKIKFRESFRPFAPIVLREQASQWFEWQNDWESPYMLLVTRALGNARLPAVTHVDGSARLQTVDRHRDRLLWQLLQRFHELTGCPAMINTSFNVRGEPIVRTPEEAFRCFMMTDMDALALGRCVLRKSEQDPGNVKKYRELATKQSFQD